MKYLSMLFGLLFGTSVYAQGQSIYSFSAKTIDGKTISFDQYKGKVLLIVNTASECGFTPQYEQLQELHEKYAQQGLIILGFPCNQFGGQEPGSAKTIASFCTKNYGVTFQLFDKIEVNGDNTHPLFQYLKSEAPGIIGTESIKWNFTKFLVTKDGKIFNRYAPSTKPSELKGEIEQLLAKE